MVWIIMACSFIAGFFFIYGGFLILASEKLQIQYRLDRLKEDARKTKLLDQELQTPFKDRIIKPFLNRISALTKRVTPNKKRASLEKKLVLAGNPGNLSPSEFLALHYVFAVLLGVCGLVIGYLNNWGPVIQFVTTIWGLSLGYVLIDFYLKMRTKNRQTDITKDLPDVLDLLTVSVEAGLGFDAAIQRVVQKTKGAISSEFAKTLQEIKMGKQRREALKDLGQRTGVEDLNTFISAIIQADQLGVSIGNVLRVQSEQMRLKRRQKIEEKAMKAPIKMLLPMIFFIFPTIFIVLLGPALIQIIENLGNR